MLILDTHIWHWWFNQIPGKLPNSIIEMIETTDDVAVSAISYFEMAWLVRHGRIDLSIPFSDWILLNSAQQCVRVIPVDQQIATAAVDLPEHHKDPMDRIIIATTLIHNAKILSFDSAFKDYEDLNDRLIGISS